MKSSTRNLVNPQVLGADMRMQALLKKQEAEHQHLLSSHHKEMQELRDSLKLALERCESLSERNVYNLKDFQEQTTYAINLLKERMGAKDIVISEQKKTLASLQDQLLNFQVLYSSMRDMESVKKDLEAQIREGKKSNLIFLQDLQREMKGVLISLKEEISKLKESADKRFSELSDRIEEKFNITRIDREGVLREIRVRQKELFILEKKIENIYTLIERMKNKRGEFCHKQE